MGRLPLTSLAIAASVLGLPRIVHADSAACDVSIVSAPPDARDAIVAWIHSERTCSKLEVRAVATEDGYLVRALRADGRIFEEVVPNARTAAERVARWAVDGEPPQIAVELEWTPRAAPKSEIHIELQWTPSAAPKPDIDIELQWTPAATPRVPPRATTEVERAIGLMPR